MSKKVVIVGAGPIGLALAYELHGKGIRNIVLIDPRAGVYTRPGHIHASLFLQLKERLKDCKGFWDNLQFHIKSFERILFKEVEKLKGITIERKQFIDFDKDQKGIVVIDKEENQETIRCEYVFDCTGSKRELIHKANAFIDSPLFEIHDVVPDIDVKNHLLAYVKMEHDFLERINSPTVKPSNYVSMIEDLRKFGWNQFKLPNCYGVTFPKGKVCLYLECPDNLLEEQYLEWMQTVINYLTNSTDIHFSTLPSSKKYAKKPRIINFSVNPQEISPELKRDERLPLIIPVGDAQIEPNYILASGLSYGLKQVDLVGENLGIGQKTIRTFDTENYLIELNKLMQEQRTALLRHYQQRHQEFIDGLFFAHKIYSLKPNLYPLTQQEINSRIHYAQALASLSDQETINIDGLLDVQKQLIKAIMHFPHSLSAMKEHALFILQSIAHHWLDYANSLAIDNRKEQRKILKIAVSLYEKSFFNGIYQEDALTIHLEIIKSYLKSKKNEEASSYAQKIIKKYASIESPLMEQIQELLNKKPKNYSTGFFDQLNKASSLKTTYPKEPLAIT